MNNDDQGRKSGGDDEGRKEVLNVELLPQIEQTERDEVQHRVNISPAVVHEAVRVEGVRELQRSASTLMSSALAAGLSMGFSLVGRGVLHYALPVAPWSSLIDSFGYSLGFLIVVLGRQQLFTENTLTAILPLFANFNRENIVRVLRLWSIVLLGNLIGAFFFAVLIAQTPVFAPQIREVFSKLSWEAFQGGFGLLFLKGIFAGWLIALMVWLLPAANTTRFHTIILLTYIIGVASFAHIIVDAVNAFYLINRGEMGFFAALGVYLLPVLIGNSVGGVAFVAFLNYSQVAGFRQSRPEVKAR